MIQAQVISYVIKSKNFNFLVYHNLEVSYFGLYSDEYNYLVEHYKKFGNVPDKETFIYRFPEFDYVDVNESEDFLIQELLRDKVTNESAQIINEYSQEMDFGDPTEAYLKAKTKFSSLNIHIQIPVKDFVKDSQERFDMCVNKKEIKDDRLIKTRLQEFNKLIYGWARDEDLVILQARPNQGKSWIAGMCLLDAWLLGENVGIFTGEMSHNSNFYRLDTLYGNFSNTALKLGTLSNIDEYQRYIESLKEHKNKFVSVDRQSLNNKATVSKLEAVIERNELNLFVIDQLSFMQDEKKTRGDQRRDELGHITDDLLNLSMKYKLPIIAVNQQKRGTKSDKDKSGEIEDLAESDKIGQNATRIISIRQVGDGLELYKAKDRHFGGVGDSVMYRWNIDMGRFDYIPGEQDRERKVQQRGQVKEGTDVF
jgi:replicative DNA helicase